MNDKQTGGPAFPTDSEAQIGPNRYHFEGMSLRDYFAAKVMQSAINRLNRDNFGDIYHEAGDMHKRIAKYSYAIADEMLHERLKGEVQS